MNSIGNSDDWGEKNGDPMPPVTSSSSGTPVPIPRTVILFTLAYLLPTISLAVLRGNGEFIYYSVIMVILVGVVLLVHLCSHLSPAVLWGLSLWGLLHMGGGLVPIPASWPADGEIRVLYSWWLIPNLLKYDQVVHAYGFGVTTFVCWQGLTAAIRGYYPDFELKPTLGVLVLCSAASMGFGGLNEVLAGCCKSRVAWGRIGATLRGSSRRVRG